MRDKNIKFHEFVNEVLFYNDHNTSYWRNYKIRMEMRKTHLKVFKIPIYRNQAKTQKINKINLNLYFICAKIKQSDFSHFCFSYNVFFFTTVRL